MARPPYDNSGVTSDGDGDLIRLPPLDGEMLREAADDGDITNSAVYVLGAKGGYTLQQLRALWPNEILSETFYFIASGKTEQAPGAEGLIKTSGWYELAAIAVVGSAPAARTFVATALQGIPFNDIPKDLRPIMSGSSFEWAPYLSADSSTFTLASGEIDNFAIEPDQMTASAASSNKRNWVVTPQMTYSYVATVTAVAAGWGRYRARIKFGKL